MILGFRVESVRSGLGEFLVFFHCLEASCLGMDPSLGSALVRVQVSILVARFWIMDESQADCLLVRVSRVLVRVPHRQQGFAERALWVLAALTAFVVWMLYR